MSLPNDIRTNNTRIMTFAFLLNTASLQPYILRYTNLQSRGPWSLNNRNGYTIPDIANIRLEQQHILNVLGPLIQQLPKKSPSGLGRGKFIRR